VDQLELRAVPATIAWDGGPTGMGTNWLDRVNWVGDVLPGTNDDAVIGPAGAGQPGTVTLPGNAAVRSIISNRVLQSTAGTLTIGAATSTFSDLVLAGGTLIPLTGATIDNSVIDGPGTLTNPSGVTLTLKDTSVNTAFVNTGGALIQLDGNVTVRDNFTNAGNLLLTGDSTNLSSALTITAGELINTATGRAVTASYGNLHQGRTITAQIANQGWISFSTVATWNNRGASTNAGEFYIFGISGGNLMLDQSSPGASFTNTGTFYNDYRLSVTGAVFTNAVGGILNLPQANGNFTSAVFAAGMVNDGTITGSGTITGNITGIGTVSPGSPNGILTVNGVYADTGPLAIDINGPTLGTQYDQLKINGAVSVNGPLVVNLSYAATVGTAFGILDNDGMDAISGTFNGLPEGAILTAGGQTFRISYVGGTGNDVTLTRYNPTWVTLLAVGDGTAQRSSIKQIKVNFDRVISYVGSPSEAFSLQVVNGGFVGLSVTTVTVGDHSEVTLTFTSDTTFGSLNDGRYTFTVHGAQILSDGVPMTSDVVNNFFRMYGDANGDGIVNGADLSLFASTFGKKAGDAGYLSYFDYNGDGVINGLDLGQFRVRFGTTLP
jgi:hypothetical protein